MNATPIPPVSSAPSPWGLAWRQLLRDFRAGELRLLIVAVMLAVAALSAVGFFADRIDGGLARDARQLLGGDAIVSSDQPAPPAFADKARALGLSTATTAAFPSMGRAPDGKGGASRLVTVKAVSEAYPLRGKVTLAGPPAAGAPAAGSVWVDPALLDALALKVGDPLLLGDATLRIANTIVNEPDRGAGFAAFAPRVILNLADLAATNLVQPASRVTYRLAVAAMRGGDAPVQQFVDWAEAQIKTRPFAACASNRSPPAGPRCDRRWTAPPSS
jgi:putative ABC transport system permease protein